MYTLKSLDNHVIGTLSIATLFGAFNGLHHWVQDTIADDFHCHVDDVHVVEDTLGDLVTIGDEPVALLFLN